MKVYIVYQSVYKYEIKPMAETSFITWTKGYPDKTPRPNQPRTIQLAKTSLPP